MRATINLHNGDCLEAMRGMADNAYELAIVDPPYNLARFRNGIGDGDRHTIKTHGTEWNNNAPTDEYWDELFRVSVNQIAWGANNFTLPTSEYFLVWDKQQTVDNFASAELAWVSMGLKMPAKVFRYGIHQHNADKGKIHPTQKPVKLYSFILDKYATEGDKILDTHGGSMSIAIACHDAGFDLDLWELDADYYAAGCKRLDDHKKQGQFAF